MNNNEERIIREKHDLIAPIITNKSFTFSRENQRKLQDELSLALLESITRQTSVENFKNKVQRIQSRHVKQVEAKRNKQTRTSIEKGVQSLHKSCGLAQKHAKKHANRYHTERRHPYRSKFNRIINNVQKKLGKLTDLNTQILHRTEGNNAVIKAAKNKALSLYFQEWEKGGPAPAKPSNLQKHLVVVLVTLSVTFFVLFQMVATGQLSSSNIQEVISNNKYCYKTQFDHNMLQVPPGLQAVGRGVTTAGPALSLTLLLGYAIFFQQQATSIGGAVPAAVIGAVATTVENSDATTPAGIRELMRLGVELGGYWHQ